ncbi:structural maintenance of chromosomes flexible hinge domain-containing protein 1-like [Oscarella lobularis]|uniref:structural maintenance of chromosomes flexible hinge domain-containing protein 1-like n=1 Tax=Oscarella lobularis TaxID=121494 RepID=UPI00331355EB
MSRAFEVFVYDRRSSNGARKAIQLDRDTRYEEFRRRVDQAFDVAKTKKIVVTNTSRQEIADGSSYGDLVKPNVTLYVLNAKDDVLVAPTDERIDFTPHYDTLVKSGIYEYYAIEGHSPAPYAFAELIDNALAATADNKGLRNIELLLHFRDSPFVCVLDNGRGMTSRQLNYWAIYRLSKFHQSKEGPGALNSSFSQQPVARSLNSDISYFGVGGKQAIFFLGNACRMVTKTRHCGDVHELSISQQEFKRRESEHQSIYENDILNRQPGDFSHLSKSNSFLQKLVENEKGKEHFTSVIISGISSETVEYLTENFKSWTNQLAHTYHYYLHGPDGNVAPEKQQAVARIVNKFKNINITVRMEYGKTVKTLCLRDVDDDLQTRIVRSAKSTFEFKIEFQKSSKEVEGIIRYHPFEYNQETLPKSREDSDDEDDEMEPSSVRARNHIIFECFWNGRLIPYTKIPSFEFYERGKRSDALPDECYRRLSGALFTGDAFHVSTNKLTFIDLHEKMKEDDVLFTVTRVDGKDCGNRARELKKTFNAWLKECHEKHDKQVQFLDLIQNDVRREKVEIKKYRYPWSSYEKIRLGTITLKKGTLMRTCHTNPVVLGRVEKFWLFGSHDGPTYAHTGEVELIQEPASVFSNITKTFSIRKIDRSLIGKAIEKLINEEEKKLPKCFDVTFPRGNELKSGAELVAGLTVGDMHVQIMNGLGSPIDVMPVTKRKLSVERKLTCESKVMFSHVAQLTRWSYLFTPINDLKLPGQYVLSLKATMDPPAKIVLPIHTIKFTVVEGPPSSFQIKNLSGPFRIGEPFTIKLGFFDESKNLCCPPPDILPVISAEGLTLSFCKSGVIPKLKLFSIASVVAKGRVSTSTGDLFDLSVSVEGFGSCVKKIRFLPGIPASIFVPNGDITIENGTRISVEVEVRDVGGNVTSQPGLNVVCELSGASSLPKYTAYCSRTGKAILTGKPVYVKNISNRLLAKFTAPGFKRLTAVTRNVKLTQSSLPSVIDVKWHKADESVVRIEHESEIAVACGSLISNLRFAVFDEAGRELSLSDASSKVKVNWTNRLDAADVRKGFLPSIPVPQSVAESKYCEVSLTGVSIDCNCAFVVQPVAGEVVRLVCSPNRENIPLTCAEEFCVQVYGADQFGNKLPKLPSLLATGLTVKGADLQEDCVETKAEKDHVLVNGFLFKTNKLGVTQLRFHCATMAANLSVNIVAGPPTTIKFLHYTNEVVTVYNNTALPSPLVVQLCDTSGNPAEIAGVPISLGRTKGFNLLPQTQGERTNDLGQVDFGILIASCDELGSFNVTPRACLAPRDETNDKGDKDERKSIIYGSSLMIRIQPNSSVPAKIAVAFLSQQQCIAGTTMPDVEVQIQAEDSSVIKDVLLPHIAMGIKDESLEATVENLKVVSPPVADDSGRTRGSCYFRNHEAPQKAANYTVLVNYDSGHTRLISSPFRVTVLPANPEKLVPMVTPAMATVTNQSPVRSRTLVNDLSLCLEDAFGNVTRSVSGSVTATILPDKDENPTPILDAGTMTTFDFENGECHVKRLLIAEGSPGKSGQSYVLRFEAVVSDTESQVAPYDIDFLFCDDVGKRRDFAQLAKRRDEVLRTASERRRTLEATEKLVSDLQGKITKGDANVLKLRQQLKQSGASDEQLENLESIDKFASECQQRKKKIQCRPRRNCLLENPPFEPEVVGKIGLLAKVEDDKVASALSWYMSSDMDCIVTTTTAKAKEIVRKSGGAQQVLPLDGIFQKGLPDWRKPLPHQRAQLQKVPGNPVYARSLLILPDDQEKRERAKKVFGLLLGDTLILDDLDSATTYRQMVVKHVSCPTILTRTGERVRSQGTFGGAQNRARPSMMRGIMFSAPEPPELANIHRVLELLQGFRQANYRLNETRRELRSHQETLDGDTMRETRRQLREAETQLRDVERQLAMHRRRRRPGGNADEPQAKMPRLGAEEFS